MVRALISEKVEEAACGDPYCCGYNYYPGNCEIIEVSQEVFDKLVEDCEYLLGYEEVDPKDYGIITTKIHSIGYVDKAV